MALGDVQVFAVALIATALQVAEIEAHRLEHALFLPPNNFRPAIDLEKEQSCAPTTFSANTASGVCEMLSVLSPALITSRMYFSMRPPATVRVTSPAVSALDPAAS